MCRKMYTVRVNVLKATGNQDEKATGNQDENAILKMNEKRGFCY